MSSKKATKRALLTSILAICLCLVMLIGSTFAWFTDTASTGVNKIVAGNLDVALEMQQKDADGNLEWVSAEGQILKWKQASAAAAGDGTAEVDPNSFTLVDSTQIFWEPGCTYQLQPIRVINNGNLALKYKIAITGITGDKGLNRVIKWTVNDQDIDTTEKKLAVGSDPVVLTIKGHMDEKAGNEYMNMHIDGIGITVYATQDTVEFDSIDNWYDEAAVYPLEVVSNIENGKMTQNPDGSYTYANTDNTVTVTVPVGAGIEEGMQPDVTFKQTEPYADLATTIEAENKEAIAYEIKVNNLVGSNDKAVTLTFPLGKNLTGVKAYHNGLEMTAGFTYDKETGIVTIETKNFSNFTFTFDPIATRGLVNVSNEKELRTALYNAPADGSIMKITLTDNITLDLLYAASNLPDSDVIQDYEVGDTLNRYKKGIHPSADDPSHWNKLVTDQTDKEKSAYGAYYHMGANDERIARLVVKANQNVIIDLNGHTIAKDARATHGDWSNTCTDIIANYGKLKVTDSVGTGVVMGHGYNSCNGAVLHNYAGTMIVENVKVDGNAAGMTAGTGQYVIVNDGGATIINGANVYDTATTVNASLLVNTAGTMTIKGNAILNHPNTKTINCKGGEVFVESATITSDKYAIYAKGGTVEVIEANVTVTGSGTMEAAGGTITKK